MISQIVAPPPPSLRQPQMFGMRMVSSREPMQQHHPIPIINTNHPTNYKYHQPFLVQHQQPQINLMNNNSPNTFSPSQSFTSSSSSSDFLSLNSASTSVASSSSSSPNIIKYVSNPSSTARMMMDKSPSIRLQPMTGGNATANASRQKIEPIYSLVNQAPVRKNTAYEARLKLNTANRNL